MRIVYVALAIILGLVFGTLQVKNGQLPFLGPVITGSVTGFLFLMFHSLTVAVTRSNLHLSFGIGLISMKFPVSNIENVAVVRHRWYHGYGIRMIIRGWLYNVSGFGMVEVTHHNGKRTRIGTDEPEELAAAINQVIGKS